MSNMGSVDSDKDRPYSLAFERTERASKTVNMFFREKVTNLNEASDDKRV